MGSEKKKVYADVVKERMARATENRFREEAEKLVQAKVAFAGEYGKEMMRLENGGMQGLFEAEWQPQIDKAADRGERETILVLQRNQGRSFSLSAQNQARYEVGVAFLSREGFSSELSQCFLEGTGGDDPYPDETFIGIKVRW